MLWDINKDLHSLYIEGYKLLRNQVAEEHTSWLDKYTTSVYRPDTELECDRFERQPLPDYIRWVKTCELHYMPWQERWILPHGVWDETPALFLPSKCLELGHFLLRNGEFSAIVAREERQLLDLACKCTTHIVWCVTSFGSYVQY